ncbi:MAG: nitrile hydratase subunit beta, partial [Pararhodobacter sp.]|nr:nitrile hydratase subunit beta [Pararhodobacter sp.]
GLVSAGELAGGNAAPAPAHPRQLSPAAVPAALARGGPTDRAIDAAPRYAPGDRVRARRMRPKTHTRLPRYLIGLAGVIEADRGGFVLPDTNAHGLGEQPQRLYTVVFDGREVWGEGAEPGLTISADLWEGYLESA